MVHTKIVWLALAATGLLAACSQDAAFKPAELVLLNGKIHTMDGAAGHEANGGTVASGLCISGGEITYVGDDETVGRRCVDSETRIVTLNGDLVLPGFIDSHMHIFQGSVSAQNVNLSLADTREKLVAALEQLRVDNPGSEPLSARGWQNHLFPPSGPRAELLDEIFGDRVVVLGSVDGHSTWFSTKALHVARLDRTARDPEPGVSFFERDPETGDLLGTARESAGWENAASLIRADAEVYRSRLLEWLPRAAAAGLTGVFDAGMRAPTEADGYRILKQLEASEALTLRVFTSTAAGGEEDDPVTRLADLQRSHTGTLVRPTAIKIFADGVPEAHTAYLARDYADRPGFQGHPMTPDQRMGRLVASAHENDLPVHVHAIGTAAITMTLDAIEKARQATPELEPRHTIAHMDFVGPSDVARFATMKVVAQTSIQWATRDPSYDNLSTFVGRDLMDGAYPVRSLIEAGVTQTFGSDWPASAYLSTFEPLTLIEVAVTRKLPGKPANVPRNADQSLTVAQAIAAMTRWSAYQVGEESRLGTLEAGKQADMIVLSDDIFELDPHRIHAAKSVLTVVGGHVVHNAM